MTFVKENSSIISRLIITHLGMAAFGAVLFLATNLKGDGIMLLASILSTIFYAVIVYSTMWEYGYKDKPAIDAGRMRRSIGKGFYVSLIAEGASFLLVALFYACSFLKGTYAIAADIYGISYILLTLADSCLTGIMIFVQHKLESDLLIALVYAFGSLFISVASALGYLAGARELHIIPQKNTMKK